MIPSKIVLFSKIVCKKASGEKLISPAISVSIEDKQP